MFIEIAGLAHTAGVKGRKGKKDKVGSAAMGVGPSKINSKGR